MVYQRGNQKEGSPHYVFLYSDDENSGDEENFPLQPRTGSTSTPRKVEVINVLVKPEDTLQALALRYRCTVISNLKIHGRTISILYSTSVVITCDFRYPS